MMIQLLNENEKTAIEIRDFILSFIDDTDHFDMDIKSTLTFIEVSNQSNVGSYISKSLNNKPILVIYERTDDMTYPRKEIDLKYIEAYWG